MWLLLTILLANFRNFRKTFIRGTKHCFVKILIGTLEFIQQVAQYIQNFVAINYVLYTHTLGNNFHIFSLIASRKSGVYQTPSDKTTLTSYIRSFEPIVITSLRVLSSKRIVY